MTVVNTNASAIKAQLASRLAEKNVKSAANRLASGNRVNSGADDAAAALALCIGWLLLLYGSAIVAP